MYKVIIIACFYTFIFSQGMYVDKVEENPLYSLNVQLLSFSNHDLDRENYYGIGLSSVFKGQNELSGEFQKRKTSKTLDIEYNYYFKPDFFLNIKLGAGYKYFKQNDDFNYNQYKINIGIFSNFSKNHQKKSKNPLKYFPFFDYVFIIDDKENTTYDLIKIGFSILFNDIGIEPSYSRIANDVNEFSIKVYLWEFGK